MVRRRERGRIGIQNRQGVQHHCLFSLERGLDMYRNRKSCGTKAAIMTNAMTTITEIAQSHKPMSYPGGGGWHRGLCLCESLKTVSRKQLLPTLIDLRGHPQNLLPLSPRCTSHFWNLWERKLSPTTLAAAKTFSAITEESAFCVDNPMDESTIFSNGTCILSPRSTYVLRFWGASSRGKSADGGVGIELFSDDVEIFGDHGGRELFESRYLQGPVTNHEAHYAALVTGLRFALTLGARNILAQGGSPVVANQITGRYRCQSPNLKPYYEEVVKLRSSFESFDIKHIPSKENSGAVRLAKAAMKLGVSDSLADINLKEAEVFGFKDGSKARVNIVPDRTYILRFDGGSRGNPGPAGGGMVLYDNDHDEEEKEERQREIWSGRKFVGEMVTSNEAEYNALIAGLRCSLALGVKNILVQGDSMLVVKQIRGDYKCRKENLTPLLKEARKLRENFLTFRIEHIPRGKNKKADALAQEAMDSQESSGLDLDQYC